MVRMIPDVIKYSINCLSFGLFTKGNMVFVLGIDIGSAASKGIILNDQGTQGSLSVLQGGISS